MMSVYEEVRKRRVSVDITTGFIVNCEALQVGCLNDLNGKYSMDWWIEGR